MRCQSNQGQHEQEGGPNISRLDPALQQQWDPAANAHLGNIDIKPYSSRKVWWTCGQCPDGLLHKSEATIYNRTKGNSCPQCSGRKVCKHNSLATKAPLVAAQWDYEANDGTPGQVVAQSHKVVGWLCDACGNKWSAAIDSRVGKMKAGCPNCADVARSKKRIRHPTFAHCQDPRGRALLAERDQRNAPKGNYPHNCCYTTLKSSKQIFWLCTKCPAGQEHSWSAAPCDRTKPSRPGCPICAGQLLASTTLCSRCTQA